MAASARLTYLKRVCKKVCLKEWRLIEQGLYKLKLEEAKKDSVLEEAEIICILVVDLVGNPARLLPLTNPFVFSSFLILPDPFSSNTPIPFS